MGVDISKRPGHVIADIPKDGVVNFKLLEKYLNSICEPCFTHLSFALKHQTSSVDTKVINPLKNNCQSEGTMNVNNCDLCISSDTNKNCEMKVLNIYTIKWDTNYIFVSLCEMDVEKITYLLPICIQIFNSIFCSKVFFNLFELYTKQSRVNYEQFINNSSMPYNNAESAQRDMILHSLYEKISSHFEDSSVQVNKHDNFLEYFQSINNRDDAMRFDSDLIKSETYFIYNILNDKMLILNRNEYNEFKVFKKICNLQTVKINNCAINLSTKTIKQELQKFKGHQYIHNDKIYFSFPINSLNGQNFQYYFDTVLEENDLYNINVLKGLKENKKC